MEKQFLSVFGPYLTNEYDPALLHAQLLELDVGRESRDLVVTIRPQTLLVKQMIFSAEQELAEGLQLKQCRIKTKYTPDQFTEHYFPEVVCALKRSVSLINGYFDGAGCTFSDNMLTITLRHGGAELLEKCHVRREIASFIFDEFSFRPEVSFDGVLEAEQVELPASTAVLDDDIPF